MGETPPEEGWSRGPLPELDGTPLQLELLLPGLRVLAMRDPEGRLLSLSTIRGRCLPAGDLIEASTVLAWRQLELDELVDQLPSIAVPREGRALIIGSSVESPIQHLLQLERASSTQGEPARISVDSRVMPTLDPRPGRPNRAARRAARRNKR